ncbi:MAG: cytosine deaminase [bacterium]
MELIIKNALVKGKSSLVDLAIENGLFADIGPQLERKAERIIDAGGRLVIPPFIDPHIHLDAALTAGNPRYNISGSHPEGIEVWGEYKKANARFSDLKERARRAVEWEVASGTLFMRSHVDICDPDLTALKILLELREELRELVEIQIVAFPQDGILAYPRGKELMREALRLGADLVGGIPHCEMTREDGVASIDFVFDLAAEFDRGIDVHCDETDDDHSRFLEVMAARAIRTGYRDRVTAGHTTAMHSYNNAYAHKIQGLLVQAGLNIVANPFDNIVLQGRFDTYPKRRGITRVKELLAAGVNVSLGHDSIMDPWYPLGAGDMLSVARMAIHACHMSGYDEMHRIFETITDNSARTMGISGRYGLKTGNPADLVILDTHSVLDALRLSPARLFVIKAGRIVAETRPAESRIHSGGQEKRVDFEVPGNR